MAGEVIQALVGVHETDPREEIFAELKPSLSKIRAIGGADLLVCRYVRPERVRSSGSTGQGIIRPDQTKDNDKYLSCSGLIIGMGPLAYQTERTVRWYGKDTPKIGDWILFDPKIGIQFFLGKRICFLIPDQTAFLILEEPDVVQ